jgi:hypothetical protein
MFLLWLFSHLCQGVESPPVHFSVAEAVECRVQCTASTGEVVVECDLAGGILCVSLHGKKREERAAREWTASANVVWCLFFLSSCVLLFSFLEKLSGDPLPMTTEHTSKVAGRPFDLFLT